MAARIVDLVSSKSSSSKGQVLKRPAESFIMNVRASSDPLKAFRTASSNWPTSEARKPGNADGNLLLLGCHLPGEQRSPPSLKGLSPPMWHTFRGGPAPCHPKATSADGCAAPPW